jgi:TM2 domain-containing membrane protein YozV
MAPLGKALIGLGLVLVVLGVVLWACSSIPFLGRLPGDFYIKRGNFTFYFPLTTCILVSVLLSLLFMLLMRR